MPLFDFPIPANFADGEKLRGTIQNAGFAGADVYVANGRVVVANVPANAAATIGALVAAHVPDVHPTPPADPSVQLGSVLRRLVTKGVLTQAEADAIKAGQ